ncbi:MAG: hypothetical protein P8O16_08230 [Algoriphagus sp.]|uniref:hypothetical protein n=1 Tax=Algoriphagus sp. TaxID=1872435 RepID=UPI0026153B59|nr:hypothetical protein [Algoriphagus sp.]MDG1277252.1 hypothetical protein [Algoriphagus sp.]
MNTIEIQIGREDFRQQLITDVPIETIRAGWERIYFNLGGFSIAFFTTVAIESTVIPFLLQ